MVQEILFCRHGFPARRAILYVALVTQELVKYGAPLANRSDARIV